MGAVEATAGPADVVFLRVAAPVIVVRGAATTAAVSGESGGVVNVSGEQEHRGLEDFLRPPPENRADCLVVFPVDLVEHQPFLR